MSKQKGPKIFLYSNKENVESIIQPFKNNITLDLDDYYLERTAFIVNIFADLAYEFEKIEKNNNISLNDYNKYIRWMEIGSVRPLIDYIISNLVQINAIDWLIIKNIDRESSHQEKIGALVFNLIQSNISHKIIATSSLKKWHKFDKGNDIFKKITSRMRNSTEEV